MKELAAYIDHTLLKPTITEEEVRQLCQEARQYQFAAVCIPPSMVLSAKNLLQQTPVKTATVIGFPFGYSVTEAKLAEIKDALDHGADEVDTVINLIHLKAGNWLLLEQEMITLVEFVHEKQKIIKVIIESGILTDREIIDCCHVYGNLGIDYLKTSTGYAERGVSLDAVRLIKKHLPSTVKVKASGGIRTYEFAIQLVEAGADRLGCSASVSIIKGKSLTEKNH